MRLSWQITMLVTVLMLLVLVTTIYISIHGSRQYLVEQMQVQAQDAGSSLAMTLMPILSAGEVALAGAMVDSSFERGYYQKIQIRDMQGKSLFERQLPVMVQGVPDWFIALTSVQSPVIQSPVVSGVTKIGWVEVAAHPANAYRALWKITLSNFKWISILAAIGIILVWLIVSFALRPLAVVKQHAEEISKQNYVIQNKFPFALELKQLVLAMNDMAEKLEILMSAQLDQVIDLANKVNTDPGTGVLSRKGFEKRINQRLAEQGQLDGQLLLIRICGLDRVNQFFSYKRGNEELRKILTCIKDLSSDEWEIARLAGADMVVFIPNSQTSDLAQRCEQLVQGLNGVSDDLQCRIGGISIIAGDNREALLTRANQALQKAMETDAGWYVGPAS